MMNNWLSVAHSRVLLLTSVCALLFVACGNDKVAGGTEAESTIALFVQTADGTPASAARVRILPNDYLSSGPAENAWNETNEDGHVSFEVRKGRYTIEARNVNNSKASGAVHSVALDETSDSKVDTIKLGELSSIEGFVVFGESVPVVRVAGLDRYVVPDCAGHFVIDSLPQGSFDVQIGEPQDVYSTMIQTDAGDTLFVDGSDTSSTIKVVKSKRSTVSNNSESDWSAHDALLKQLEGYAEGTLGAAGATDRSGKIREAKGEICVVTTTDDYALFKDSAKAASGSLRECAEKEGPVWILFENDGTYKLQTPLRIKSNKTIDGRGRDVRITGMGILTNESSNLIFENLTFTAPSITVQDTTSRRALSIHNLSHHVWIDHCLFEEYPLIELDIKRSSYAVTVSWSRFENAQTGILFGLEPDIYVDSLQTFTLHHNYFANLDSRGVVARYGKMHVYDNFFSDVKYAGIECSDSALCYIESNVFNNETPVLVYRVFNDDVMPDVTTQGYVYMQDNMFGRAGENLSGDALGFKPDYKAVVEKADADLAARVKKEAGPR